MLTDAELPKTLHHSKLCGTFLACANESEQINLTRLGKCALIVIIVRSVKSVRGRHRL